MRLRLVMAVSADGFMSKREDDDMSWLGPDDKAVFRILTGVGGVLGAGSGTVRNMPRSLPGRTVVCLSRSGVTLGDFVERHPGAWLLGGPELARQALLTGLLDEVHLCRSRRLAAPVSGFGAWPDVITPLLEARSLVWGKRMSTTFGDTTVENWARR